MLAQTVTRTFPSDLRNCGITVLFRHIWHLRSICTRWHIRYKGNPGSRIFSFAKPLRRFHGIVASAVGVACQAGLLGIFRLAGAGVSHGTVAVMGLESWALLGGGCAAVDGCLLLGVGCV